MPYLIAIETCSESSIRSRAFRLHQQLAEKHASFIHSKNIEGVRLAFSYQTRLIENSIGGSPWKVVGMSLYIIFLLVFFVCDFVSLRLFLK